MHYCSHEAWNGFSAVLDERQRFGRAINVFFEPFEPVGRLWRESLDYALQQQPIFTGRNHGYAHQNIVLKKVNNKAR